MRVRETLMQSPTYQERLNKVKDAHLDTPKLLKELQTLLSSRIEVYYNKIASGTPEDTFKADKVFLDYVKQATDLLKDFKKVSDDYNMQTSEGNVDLNIVQEQVGIVRDTVRDLLAEIEPALALEFMDKLNVRMSSLKYEMKKTPDIMEQVEKLNERIRKIQEESGGMINE